MSRGDVLFIAGVAALAITCVWYAVLSGARNIQADASGCRARGGVPIQDRNGATFCVRPEALIAQKGTKQ